VPAGITVIQAAWHIGRDTTRGVGCLGGACGACPISFLLPGSFYNQSGLACQTLVEEGMSITFLPSDPPKKQATPLPSGPPDAQHLFRYYRETRRCVSCGACSNVCPQGIDAMGGVRAAINGDLDAVSEKFTSCVVCGLCASVCGARIQPHRVGLYARRLVGAFGQKDAPQLLSRIEAISSGQYDAEWPAAMAACEQDCALRI